jgi:exopolysaccharide production protein ExoZ
MIWSLQVLRFIAAALVVYFHSVEIALWGTGSVGLLPHELARVGNVGVDLFFVISGVVVARTAPALTPSQFIWKRIRRIIPIYWIMTVPFGLLSVCFGSVGKFGWREALATIALWPATAVMTAPILPVAWTLSFEMLFYICTALVILDRRYFTG